MGTKNTDDEKRTDEIGEKLTNSELNVEREVIEINDDDSGGSEDDSEVVNDGNEVATTRTEDITTRSHDKKTRSGKSYGLTVLDKKVIGGVLVDEVEPSEFHEAWDHPNKDENLGWRLAINKELGDMEKRGVWTVVKDNGE